MQRFLREPLAQGHAPEQLKAMLQERMAVIERHFPPSVAHAYAIPKLGADGALEWWTTQQGTVVPYAALAEDRQRALMDRHAEHQTQLDSLAQALEANGMKPQAALVRSLATDADPARMYSVEGRLLLTRRIDIAPEPVPVPMPPPPRRRWPWIVLPWLLLLALLLAALWWWMHRQPVPAPAPVAVAIPPEPDPAPAQQSDPSSKWPTELVFLLDTSSAMGQPPKKGAPPREVVTRREIGKVVEALPPQTDTHLVRYAGTECAAPALHDGPYKHAQRAELLKAVAQPLHAGPAPFAAGLRAAAAAVDGKQRDALIFAFVGAADGCGGDVCEAAAEIHKDKPLLRINVVDMTGTRSLATCVSQLTGGEWYGYGEWGKDARGVDLSREAARMLAP
ncbi:hypothetical protein [Achromobacter aloeverae]